MNLFVPSLVRVEKDRVVRIHRKLAGKGNLRVLPNQQVSPTDVLGSAQISPGFRIINLAKILSVSASKVQKYLKKTLGQRIYKGELLAFKEAGVFSPKAVVIAPTDGVLDFFNPKTGEIKMAFLPRKEDLTSGVYGIVEEVDNQKGQVIIRVQATLIHGMFGSGRNRDGILHVIGKRDELIGPQFIPSKYGGQILVGGNLVLKEAISTCISAGIGGFITGGINAKDYKAMAGSRLTFPKKLDNDIGISIVICEGFGSAPIGEDIFEVLKKFHSKFVLINGNKGIIILPSFESSSLNLVKKVSLPPEHDVEAYYQSRQQLIEVKKGLMVRIIGNTFTGEQGKVISLDQTETVIPAGLRAVMVTIETRKRKLQIPVANLEVIL